MRPSRFYALPSLFLFLLVSLVLLPGCTNGFFAEEDYASARRPGYGREAAPVSDQSAKFRHPQLLERAKGQPSASKSDSPEREHFFIAFHQ